MSFWKFDEENQRSIIGGIATVKSRWQQCEKYPNQQTLFDEFTDLDQYLGIQEDPLGKTQEKYHVRMKEEYYLDDKSQLMTQYKLYFRVRDLAPVYYTENDFMPNKAFSYTEWLDGGMVEFQGTFVKSDFHIPGCVYTTETHAFLE